jgi:hypothetical protein
MSRAFVKPSNVERILEGDLRKTPVIGIHWRVIPSKTVGAALRPESFTDIIVLPAAGTSIRSMKFTARSSASHIEGSG